MSFVQAKSERSREPGKYSLVLVDADPEGGWRGGAAALQMAMPCSAGHRRKKVFREPKEGTFFKWYHGEFLLVQHLIQVSNFCTRQGKLLLQGAAISTTK